MQRAIRYRLTGVGALGLLAALAVAVTAWPAGARAQSFFDSLASAYSGNPTLGAERARQRATDEQVPQALSGWRPTVIAEGNYGHRYNKILPRCFNGPAPCPAAPNRNFNPGSARVGLSQPIFSGFQTVNGTRQAEATVEAGRQALLSVEQTVLFDAVSAYMNVIRDRRIVELRVKNLMVLREQQKAAKARFDVGEITRTDVEQAKARTSLAESDLSRARANQATSEATFVRVIGYKPGKLASPGSPGKRLPRTIEAAISIAETRNPSLLAATFTEEASRYAVAVAVGELLPTLSAEATYTYQTNPSNTTRRTETAEILGVLTVPIYQNGGRDYSLIREAKETNSQHRIEIVEARRIVREAVVQAWHLFIASGQVIRSAADQVKANELALEGVKQEALVGSRTTLDVLDAEQELVDSQVQLTVAQRDEVVAGYQLIAAIGRLTAIDLGLKIGIYDSLANYHRVRNKIFGLDSAEEQKLP